MTCDTVTVLCSENACESVQLGSLWLLRFGCAKRPRSPPALLLEWAFSVPYLGPGSSPPRSQTPSGEAVGAGAGRSGGKVSVFIHPPSQSYASTSRSAAWKTAPWEVGSEKDSRVWNSGWVLLPLDLAAGPRPAPDMFS